QREDDEREKPKRAEEREDERADVQDDRGDPRDRELRHLRAELADRLAGPQLYEVGVTPQRALWFQPLRDLRHLSSARATSRARSSFRPRSPRRGSPRRV